MNNNVIRLELLKLAKDILMEENMNARIKLENEWHATSERGSFPEVPVVKGKDIVKLATLLDKFVTQNNEQTDND